MAATFGLLAVIPNVEKLTYTFLIIYGLSYFFTELGPNATTFVYPSEVFPVKVRTTGHGIAASTGKIGGFVGVFTFPFFMHWRGRNRECPRPDRDHLPAPRNYGEEPRRDLRRTLDPYRKSRSLKRLNGSERAAEQRRSNFPARPSTHASPAWRSPSATSHCLSTMQ